MSARWYVWRGDSGTWYAEETQLAQPGASWRRFRNWREAYDFADAMARQ